ncbi:lactonase family protein [Collimonas sp. OK242]|uniref:lactonase family protein n=1 Tax=Collimonas sp. OK242 TaxID=1798195 RepID=UPI0021010DAD|nr:lactonase family protein [Collimonas sp. OK242]
MDHPIFIRRNDPANNLERNAEAAGSATGENMQIPSAIFRRSRRMALSLALLTMTSMPLKAETPPPPAPALFAYVGTYHPNGAGVYLFKVDSQSGALSRVKVVSTLPNAAQLDLDAGGKTLYVASEVGNYNDSQHGVLAAYAVNRTDGSLTLLNQQDAQGKNPVHVALTPKQNYLLAANYGSGSVASFPLAEDGSLLAAVSVRQSTGPAGAARPEAAAIGSFAVSGHDSPHAHMIASDPSGKFAFSTDLGLDRIYQWRFDQSSGSLTPNTPPFIKASSAGAGPRHFVFHPNGKYVYLINEESSTLTLYHFDQAAGTLQEQQTVSSLPKNYQGTSFAAGLALSHDGRFLYVANRLRNSIVQFAIGAQGKLSWVEETWTRGDYPRSIVIEPQGRYIYALNQRSDNITQFAIDKHSGKLEFIDRYTGLGSPSQMVFLR